MDNSNTLIFDFNKINIFIILDMISEFIGKYKLLLILINVTFVVFVILILMIVFFVTIKILDISLDKMVLFYDYNKLCCKMLKKYGECEINKIYLVRTTFTKLHTFITNILTLFEYDELVKQSTDNIPYHTMILIEIKLKNDDKIKWLLLEKNNCISMNDNFVLTHGMEVKEIELKKEKNIYLKDFLEETRNRMGNENFFNWHLFKNNCQEFTKELLITVGSYDDYYKKIIFSNKIFELIHLSEFFYCMFNCLCIFYNFLEKNIFELDLFELNLFD